MIIVPRGPKFLSGALGVQRENKSLEAFRRLKGMILKLPQ